MLTRILILAIAAGAGVLRAQDDLPQGRGRETLESTCTECHGLDRVLSRLRTTGQWRTVVTQMRLKGATMTDEELNTLVGYLSQNFGAVETPAPDPEAKVNVNKATAAELESGLRLRAADAAAIVRHRQDSGPYKQWRDLLKVAGIDRARIEAVKDRLAF